jgi:hypothetical protein
MPSAGGLVKAYETVKQDTVTTNETTASGTFGDLATAGPTVTVNLEVGQSVLIIVEAHAHVAAAGTNGAVWAPEVAGPSTSDLAATDANGCEVGDPVEWIPGTKHTLFTATAEGAHVITIKYRVIGATTGSFKYRRLTAIPLPI